MTSSMMNYDMPSSFIMTSREEDEMRSHNIKIGVDSETFDFVQYVNINRLPDYAVPVDVFAAMHGWRIFLYQASY